jgi:hypothetical protein
MILVKTTSSPSFFLIDIHFISSSTSLQSPIFLFPISFICQCRLPVQVEITYYLHKFIIIIIIIYCAAHCFRDALTSTLSALYGKLLVVMGIAFPMAEVISTYIPPSFYEVSTQGDVDLTSHS